MFFVMKKFTDTKEKEELMMKKSRSNSRETWKIFWRHAMKYKGSAIIIVVGVILVSATDVIQPILFGKFIDAINRYVATQDPEIKSAALLLGIVLTAQHVVHQVLWRTMGFVNSSWAPRVVSDLMNTYYEYLHEKAYAFFANTPAGAITAAASRFINSYESVDNKLKWNLGRMAIIAIFIQASLFWRLPLYGWIVFGWFVFYVSFAYFFARYKQPHDLAAAEQHSAVNVRLADTIANSVTVKQYSNQEYENREFQAMTQKHFELRKVKYLLGQRGEVIQSIAMVLLRSGTVFLTLMQVMAGIITVGDLILVYM